MVGIIRCVPNLSDGTCHHKKNEYRQPMILQRTNIGKLKFTFFPFLICFKNILILNLQSFLEKAKKITEMKKGIHPEYRDVVFQDTSSDYSFKTRSTMTSKDTIKWEDGKEYPLIKLEVSSASHPFYTGKKIFVDTAGRVEKFNRKYGKKK